MGVKKIDIRTISEAISYDPNTGQMMWKKKSGPKLPGMSAGCLCKTHGYILIRVDTVLYMAHRIAWVLSYGREPDGHIDHINGNKSDNRIMNLREATPSQNMFNRGAQSNNACGLKGVCFNPKIRGSKKWSAEICENRKRHKLGLFSLKSLAAVAYAKAAIRYHGKFANT